MARCGAAFGAHKPVLHRNISAIVLIVLDLVKYKTRGWHLSRRAGMSRSDDRQRKCAAEDIAFRDCRQCAGTAPAACRNRPKASKIQALPSFRACPMTTSNKPTFQDVILRLQE